MKVIIAGSRGLDDYDQVCEAMDLALVMVGIAPSVVLSGAARGVDALGEKWASERGLPIDSHPAPWGKYPKLAGHMRNVQMGRQADALVAIWDGSSRGTLHMIEWMRKAGKPVYVHQT